MDDPSVFVEKLRVRGTSHDELSVLRVRAASVPNAVAVIALEICALTPDIYFEWVPGNLLRDMLRLLAFGRGQNATVTREILRRHVPEEWDRPTIHVS